MPGRVRRLSVLCLSLALVSALILDVGAANAGTPTASANPDSGLVDGQIISVSGTGLDGFTFVAILLCGRGLGVPGCDQAGTKTVRVEAGGFTAPFSLNAILRTEDLGAIDCRSFVAGCDVTIVDEFKAVLATAPVTFDPSAPLAPPPALTVDPDTGLVRHQTVAVTGSGFRAEEPYFLMQCLATEPPWGGCAGVERVDTEPTGDLVTTYRVRVIVGGDGLPRGDCRVDPCDLVVTQSEQPEDPPEARVPLEFASAATEPVPAAPASAAPAVPAFTG